MNFARNHNRRITALENRQIDLDALRDNQEDLLGRIRELESRLPLETENENDHSCESAQNKKQCKAQRKRSCSNCQNIQDK